MKTSAAGRALIEAFEGLRLTAYQDSVGVLTIGYGHTNAAGLPRVVPGMTISKQTADNTLANDLRSVEENVERCVHGVMSQCEFDALVSFDFNTGSLGKSTIDDKINRGDKTAAMATLLLYNHGRDRETGKLIKLPGLVRRRKAEKLMYEGNVDAALKLAGAHEIIGKIAPVAKAEPAPQKQPQSRKTGVAAVVVAATTVAATQGDSWPIIAAIVAGGIALAIILYLVLNKKG